MKPSMSKAAELIACQWWAAPDLTATLPEVVGEPAEYGTAFHEVLARSLLHRKLQKPLSAMQGKWPELAEHTADSFKEIMRWLGGENPWQHNFQGLYAMEVSVAFDVHAGTARTIDNPTAQGHVYEDCSENELPGTADLIVWPRRGTNDPLLVLDHKTGVTCDPPDQSAQLKALALAAAKMMPSSWKGPIIGAINHSPREGAPTVYATEFYAEALREFHHALEEAWNRIGDGTLRPGPQCKYCPALAVCPTQSTLLVALGKNQLALSETPEDVGRVHDALEIYAELAEQLKAWMKETVQKIGPGIKKNGRLLVLNERSRETISKAAITRALGTVKGNALIEKGRKEGWVTTTTYTELRAESDRGGRR